jgi:5-methylcytosine-specific restriction protein A
MICGYPGFSKKNGGKYAEVHHMIELNENAPKRFKAGIY